MKKEKNNHSITSKVWGKFRDSSYVELLGIVCLLITYSVFVQSQNSIFLSYTNMMNVLNQIVVYAILSCALAFPMIGGTFDLSNGAVAALGGIICAMLTTNGLFGVKTSVPAAILISIVICCVVGVVNGVVVAYTTIPSFIVTLGADTAIRGLVYIVSGNTSVGNLPKTFTGLSSIQIGPFTLPVFIMIIIFLIVGFVFKKTSFGRMIYATGGNCQATFLSGVNVKIIRLIAYIICAGLSAVAGILMTSRVGSATPSAADGYATIAIAACTMGGVSLAGGSGTVLGVFLGATMMGFISNGMNLMHIGSNWQLVTRGILMVVAVFYSLWINKMASRNQKK